MKSKRPVALYLATDSGVAPLMICAFEQSVARRNRARLARSLCVNRERELGLEGMIAFDRKTEWTSDGRYFRKAQITEFREALAGVAEPESGIRIICINFGEEPCCAATGRKESDDREGVVIVWEVTVVGEHARA